MEKIQVGYSRKEATNDYGSIGISGLVEFVPQTDDLQAEFDQYYVYLKMVVDAKLEGLNAKESKAEGVATAGHIPPHPDTTSATDRSGDSDAQAAGEEPIGQNPVGDNEEQGASRSGSGQATKDEVFLNKAKVFRVDLKRDRKNNVYAELRVGHEDLNAHINDQYVTVKSWDPEVVSTVGSVKRMKDEETGEIEDVKTFNIHSNYFVDVWGKFNPWYSDKRKFDLNASALRVTPE